MALGSRELLLVIRARDEASRAMHSLSRSMRDVDRDTRRAAAAQIERGRAMSSVGVGIMAVGAAGAAALVDWTKAAMSYEHQAAKTLTQVDKQKASLEDIKRVGLEVAKAIPAPLEQMQETLFYIFSSMDTDLKGSERLLKDFAKAGVAGQVDLQDAARGTIGILNAYNLTAKDSVRVNDVMFELVRKGVGTYGEFSKVIGRAVPSAVRAGQSIENLAGMMAFLTRNGLSTAMAAASAARALDALSHPKTVTKFENLDKAMGEALGEKRIKQLKATTKNFDDLGVKVVNAAGKFRPINDVMTDMGKTFQRLKLTGPEIAAILQEVFKGSGGTIQARRFFDVALKNFDELNVLTDDMKDSAGALDNAYNIMFKQPQSQIQLLKNNYEALKIELGQALLPIVIKLAQAFTKLFQWFNDLSPTTKKWIAWILIAVTALTLIIGAVVTVVGFFLIFAGAAAAAGIALSTVGIVIGVIIAVIVALGVAVFFVIKYWDPIKGFFIGLWNAVVGFFVSAWNKISSFLSSAFAVIWNIIKTAWNVIVTIFKVHVAIILTLVILWWRTLAKPMRWFFNLAWDFIKGAWNTIASIFKWAFNIVSTVTKVGWAFLRRIFTAFWNWVKPYVMAGINFIRREWDKFWGGLRKAASVGWNLIKGEFNRFWSAMKTGFRAGKNAIVAIWNSIKKPLAGPVNFVIDVVWNKGIASAWNTAVDIVDLPSKFRAPRLSPVRWATGGFVSGPGGPTEDKIPALLSDGEFVVRAAQTKKWLPVLQAINSGLIKRGEIPGFQLGGLVGKLLGGAKFIADVFMNPAKAMEKVLSYPLKALRSIGGGKWGQVIAEAPRRMVSMMAKGFTSIFEKFGAAGVPGVVKAAQRWIGTGDTGADNVNMFSKRWGMPGAPWCAMFVSSCIEAAKAGKLYRGYPSAAVASYAGSMKHSPNGSGGPGWLAAYRGSGPGGWGHINIIEQNLGGGRYRTIGGNEGPVVKRGTRSNPSAILRPGKFARGGIVDAIFENNFDPRDRRNPLLQAYRTILADNGAYVRPGLNAIMNHTGGRERILDPEETAMYERGEGRGRPIIIYTQEIDPRRHAAELGWELDRRVT